jgi:hypothetical protein
MELPGPRRCAGPLRLSATNRCERGGECGRGEGVVSETKSRCFGCCSCCIDALVSPIPRTTRRKKVSRNRAILNAADSIQASTRTIPPFPFSYSSLIRLVHFTIATAPHACKEAHASSPGQLAAISLHTGCTCQQKHHQCLLAHPR